MTMSDGAWIRVEGGRKIVEDPEALGRWLSMAEAEEVWVPAAHVEGTNGDLKVERSNFIEQLPVNHENSEHTETAL